MSDLLTHLDQLVRDALHEQELSLELRNQIHEQLFRNFTIKCVQQMDESAQSRFAAFMESNPSEEALAGFLKTEVPGVDAVLQQALVETAEDITALASEA